MSDTPSSDGGRVTEIEERLAEYDAREPYSADVLRDAAPSDIRWLITDRAALVAENERLRDNHAVTYGQLRQCRVALNDRDARIESLTRDAAAAGEPERLPKGVSIRKRTFESPAGPRTVFEVVILCGKGRKRADVIRARLLEQAARRAPTRGEPMRSGLRPKKGDLHVVLNDGENSIAFLLERDKAVELVKLLGERPRRRAPVTDERPNLAEQMRQSQQEDDAERDAARPATEGYTGEPCQFCGRVRVYLRRDRRLMCEKCEQFQPTVDADKR